MRARRITFFGLMILSMLTLLYTGETLYLWIVFFQLAMLLISLFSFLYTFTSIRFNQRLNPRRATKGDTVSLRLELHNESFLPFAHLTLQYSTPDSVYTGAEYYISASILPGRHETITTSIECPYRGEYEIGFTRIEATDIFGLIKISLPFKMFRSYQPIKLLVYPRIREIASGFLFNLEAEGPIDSDKALAEELSSIADIRNFREGDPLKRVHWKLSARNQKLLVKDFEASLSADCIIMVDCTDHGFTGEQAAKYEDTVVECAAAFCKRMTNDYQPLRLITYSSQRKEIIGAAPVDFPAFYELLALIKFEGSLNLSSAMKLEKAQFGKLGSVVIITQSPSDELFEEIITLSQSDCRILLVAVLDNDLADARIIRMFGEFSLRGINALTLFPGEDISLRLGGL